MGISLTTFDYFIVFHREPCRSRLIPGLHGNSVKVIMYIIVIASENPPVSAQGKLRHFPEGRLFLRHLKCIHHCDIQHCKQQTVIVKPISRKIQSAELRQQRNLPAAFVVHVVGNTHLSMGVGKQGQFPPQQINLFLLLLFLQILCLRCRNIITHILLLGMGFGSAS